MQHSSVPASTSEMSHHVWWLWQPEKETIFFIFLKYNLVEMNVLFMKSIFKKNILNNQFLPSHTSLVVVTY